MKLDFDSPWLVYYDFDKRKPSTVRLDRLIGRNGADLTWGKRPGWVVILDAARTNGEAKVRLKDWARQHKKLLQNWARLSTGHA